MTSKTAVAPGAGAGPEVPRGLIAVLSACNFVIGMGAFMVIGLIDLLAQDLSTSLAAAGGLMTAYAVGYAVLSPLLVSMTGAIGRRRVLAAGLAVFALANVLAAIAPALWMLYPLRILAAAGAGLVTPVGLAIAAALSAPERRGKTLAAVFFGLTLAQVLGIPAGSWITYTFGWRLAFAAVAILTLPCLVLVWRRVPAGLSFRPTTLSDLRGVLSNRLLMGTAFFTASLLCAVYALFTYLPPLLTQDMGFGRDGIALALLVFGLGAVVGNLMGGWLSDGIGPIRTLTVICLAQTTLMPVFSGLPLPVWLVLALVFIWSLMGWSFTAPQQMRLIALSPEQAPVLLSLNAAAIYVGIAGGSAIGAGVIALGGLQMLGAAAGGMALLALVHLMWSHRAANLRAMGRS